MYGTVNYLFMLTMVYNCAVTIGYNCTLYSAIRSTARIRSCSERSSQSNIDCLTVQMAGSSNNALFPYNVCGMQFSQEQHLLHHFRAKKHLKMKDIKERAAEYSAEESEAAMYESVSEPDSRDSSTMVEEGDHNVDSYSDVDSNEPDQQGFDPVDALVDVTESAEFSAEEDANDSYESSLINEG